MTSAGTQAALDAAEATAKSASAQVASARAAEYVARASLLAAMGQLEGPALNPTIEAYDPATNYDQVKGRGGLPWDGVIETLDRVASPPIVTTPDTVDAPIDAQLKGEVVRTAPQN